MTIGQFTFSSAPRQQSQEVVFTLENKPDDYSFVWVVGALAVALFIVFFWRIRKQSKT
jgi:hypothetical protein